MANDIIIRTEKTFQAKELNDAVKGLQKAFTNIDKNRKDACLIMWRLEDGKKYEKDGFKSLQDFAESIGIDKSTAHKMADAGRAYDSKIPAIAQFANDAGYTVAANIASMLKDTDQEKALSDAIDAKEVTADMTVDKVKAWKADAVKASKPEKIVPNWNFSCDFCTTDPSVPANEIWSHFERTVGISDPKDWAREFYADALVSVITVPQDGTKIYLAVTPDGSMFRYTAEKVKKETKKPATKSAKNMTTEELQAKIAEYQALLAAQAEQK